MKRVSFFDGVSSETTPVLGNISTTELVQYASDAAFEAVEQGAPIAGNIYFNTTDNNVRYYNGTSWTNVADDNSSQTFTNKTIDGNSNTLTNIDGDNVIIDEDLPLAAGTAQSVAKDHEDRIVQNETDIASKIDSSEKGVANGVATLDAGGLVPSSQLPSFVDDVLEYADQASFPATGETGKIYVALDTNLTYRWSGSVYVEISSGPADTDDVPEGATNLYYTDTRVDARIAAASIDDLSDVDTTTVAPTDGQALLWDSGNAEWSPGDVSGGTGGGFNVTSQSTTYSASISDAVLADSSSAAFTITLPAASGNDGGEILIKKIDTGINKVTIDGNGSETIEGQASIDLDVQNEQVTLLCNGVEWFVISHDIPFVGASAYLVSSQSVPSSSITKFNLTGEEYDSPGYFDNGSGYEYTPLVKGYYQVNANCFGSGFNNRMEINIYKNGSPQKTGHSGGVSGDMGAECPALVYCNGTTDTLDLRTLHFSSGSITYSQAAVEFVLIKKVW